jgi:hypothetical protein
MVEVLMMWLLARLKGFFWFRIWRRQRKDCTFFNSPDMDAGCSNCASGNPERQGDHRIMKLSREMLLTALTLMYANMYV